MDRLSFHVEQNVSDNKLYTLSHTTLSGLLLAEEGEARRRPEDPSQPARSVFELRCHVEYLNVPPLKSSIRFDWGTFID